MKNKLLTILGTTLIASLSASPTHASSGNSIVDYARVTRVEPIYRYITIQEPQRQCEYVRPTHQPTHGYHHNPNRPPRQFIRGQSITYNNTDSAVVVGGVIGGAIGHQLSASINGRSNPAITLTGAAIGSALAHNAASNSTSYINIRKSRQRNQIRHTQGSSHNQQYGHHGNQLVERCVTTTVSRQERRRDGYTVTYVYHGNTFQTRTDQHPGDEIRVRVQVKPH